MAQPGPLTDERELLLAWLQFLREAVLRKGEGLDEDQVRWRPDGRLISIAGIVNHLTHVEWRWIRGATRRAGLQKRGGVRRPPRTKVRRRNGGLSVPGDPHRRDRPKSRSGRHLPPSRAPGHHPAVGPPPSRRGDRTPCRPRRCHPGATGRVDRRVRSHAGSRAALQARTPPTCWASTTTPATRRSIPSATSRPSPANQPAIPVARARITADLGLELRTQVDGGETRRRGDAAAPG